MNHQLVKIAARGGGSFDAYLAAPKGVRGPGVVMIQEIFGITPWMKEIAGRFAGRGYVVVVPDLFWRMQPNFVGDPAIETERARGFAYRAQLDHDGAVDDMASCLQFLKGHGQCNGRVAVTGFCLGGTMAYLAAARLEIEAAVSYYGTQIHENLDQAKNLCCPLLLYMARRETNYTPEDGRRIEQALAGRPGISVIWFDSGHAFANSARPDLYAPDAAERAHALTFELFDGLK